MIDWAQVGTLRDDIGHDEFVEIVEIFLEEVDDVIDRLRSAPDLQTLGDDLHFLKGSALNLGFSAFSNQCQLGETTSSAGHAAQVDVPKILATYDISKAQFLSELPSAFSV